MLFSFWIKSGVAKNTMKHKFRTGNHVSWNSEGGRVSGKIIKYIQQTLFIKDTHTTPAKKIPNTKLKVIILFILLFIKDRRLLKYKIDFRLIIICGLYINSNHFRKFIN